VVAFNSKDEGCKIRYAKLAKTAGIANHTDDTQCAVDKLIAFIADLKTKMHMHSSIIEWGLDRAEFEAGKRQLAENALLDTCTQSTPKMPTVDEVLDILTAISK
ncbi:MAG: iron-containing alcohol dehydrogenase, partial [Eubacterium sp.]|nr:iron-containing alcohol dehydrogenase [Eubacterium sp.]